jgi:hypothetical protein
MASAEGHPLTLELAWDSRTLRIAWDRRRVRSRSDDPGPRAASAWRLEGEPDWSAVEGVRLISATFEDGRTLALAALRPRGARGHDGDSIAHHLESSGEPVELTEALISTEYDAGGLPRRVGAELWIEPGSAPLRLAGDRLGEVEVRDEAQRHELARMSFRLEGVSGVGTYELLRAG